MSSHQEIAKFSDDLKILEGNIGQKIPQQNFSFKNVKERGAIYLFSLRGKILIWIFQKFFLADKLTCAVVHWPIGVP